ncbi:MAG: uracil-DNA glycosylase [Pseudomonadota bacterium]
MLSERQLRYLTAMGIPAWQARHAADHSLVEETAEVSASIEEPVATHLEAHPQVQPESTVSQGAPVLIDPSQLDWPALQEAVRTCQACPLAQTRTQTVFGVGDPQASWMFVGEAPGAEEDRQGLPFVGRAGQLLTAMIQAMGMKREEVYIANMLKCRPPGNRDPRPEEVHQCEGYLKRQVALVQPKIMVALGRIAAQNLLKTDESLAKLRGKVFRYGDAQIPLVVTYHPAYLLRNPADKAKAWQDLCFATHVAKAQK